MELNCAICHNDGWKFWLVCDAGIAPFLDDFGVPCKFLNWPCLKLAMFLNY